MKTFVFALVMIIAIVIGGTLATWTFFGLLTFAGFVGMVESIPILKWICIVTGKQIGRAHV